MNVSSALLLLPLLLVPEVALAQASETMPRTPWGAPDLTGYWKYVTMTPLERPPGFEDKPVLPPDEAAIFLSVAHAIVQRELDRQLNADGIEFGGLTNNRTSLIVDPADGRVPEHTEYGRMRNQQLGFFTRSDERPYERRPDGPEDRERYERCILGRTMPMVATIELQLLQIFQTPRHVVFLHEQNSDVRIVPLDGSPPVSDSVRLWQGSSRGRWDGDTLVVTTTNLNGEWTLHGDGPNVRLVERIRIDNPDTLDYSVTVSDSEAFAAPWTVQFPIERTTGPLYETACHEGNYSMELMLRGARAEERREQAR